MWATLALVSALNLAPAQAGQLSLTNARVTNGMFGVERKEPVKLVVGDSFFLAFDIENLQVGPDGRASYSLGMTLSDKAGKPHYKQEPTELEALLSLGGSSLPGNAEVLIGLDTAPGEYTLEVTITDRRAKVSKTLSKKFELLPKDFAIVRLQTKMVVGNNAAPAPRIAVPGQELLLTFSTMGFGWDKAKKQPNMLVEMSILDDTGKPTLEKPFTATNDVVPADALSLGWTFFLKLNRPGKFTVNLKATDRTATDKVSQVSVPITVVDPYQK